MKYRFDIDDIEHASRCWYAQLDLLAETEEADTQLIDGLAFICSI